MPEENQQPPPEIFPRPETGPTEPLPQPPTVTPPTPPETAGPLAITPRPKKSKKWLWAVLVLIILIPAGLIFATEQSYLNLGLHKYYNAIGLERLWGGLPIDGPKALFTVSQKMKEATSYHFSGTFVAEGNVSLENIPQITKVIPPEQGRVLGQSAESMSIKFNLAGDYEKPDKISATFAFSLTSEQLESLIAPSFNLDFRSIENKVYFKIPALSTLVGEAANKWLVVDMGQYQTKKQDLFQKIPEMSKNIKSSQRLKSETVNGKAAYHYQMVLDKKISPSLLSDPKIDYFIGKKDHFIYKAQVNMSFGIENSQVNLNGEAGFSDFNKPVDISPPEEEEIAKEGILGLLGGLKIPGTEEAQVKARDAQRKSDLQQIKAA